MKRIFCLAGLLAACAAMAAAAGEKTFILKSSTRDLNEFRAFVKIASRLKPYGNVQVDIGVLADKSWYEIPKGGSPWHEYASDHGTLYKFYPHPKIAPFLPADWVEKNRQLLLAKARILREAGLDAAFSSNDTHFLPEAFFRRYPHLRGPRVDHPRRSRHEEFSWCVDQPETLEMIEWMAAELKRNVPEIKTIMSLNNDSGSGLCWSAALYSGPNGPAFCHDRNVGERARGLLEAIHRGFEKGGGNVVTRLYGNFWQNEDEIVLAHLPPDSYLEGKDRSTISVGTLSVEAYPVLGLIDPLGLYASLERYNDPAVRTIFVNTVPYYNRFDEPLETSSRLIDLIEDYIAQPARGLLERFDKLRKLALQSAGERNVKTAFEAFYNMDQAFRLKQAAAPRYSNLYCGVSMRQITRPLLIRPDLLDPEQERYFLPYIFNISENEGRMDYTDLHGSPYTGPAAWDDPGLRSALSTALQAARAFESLKDAPQQSWLNQLGLSLRLWASEVRSIHNFYFAQQLRDRNRQAISGETKVHEKVATWEGDRDFIPWTRILRDELDNTDELLALLDRGGLKYIGHAADPRYEDTFLLGPNLPDNLRQKVDIMREHWLDVQKYLAPPHK
jgi:hypothetical protein